MDSPGHSAQYCTYTFMENSTHKIIHIVVMDKHMTGEGGVENEVSRRKLVSKMECNFFLVKV